MKLNVGCGHNIIEGWTNLDWSPADGVDIVFDLETCRDNPIPLEDDSVDEFLISHVLEHIVNVLPLMEELYRIATPDAVCYVRVPDGASDTAWEDQTHVRAYHPGSFQYFEQPCYHIAPYRYSGDWKPETIQVVTKREYYPDLDDMPQALTTNRNLASEILVILRAIKPARPRDKSLKTPIRPIARFA